MSKAFTKEDDAAPLGPLVRPPTPSEGPRRPITAEGAERLETERRLLLEGGEPSSSARLQQIHAVLASVQVQAVEPDPEGRILFGAWVELADDEGRIQRYRLVGPDEADAREGRLSVQSPLARALLGKREGAVVLFDRPLGEVELTVVSVRYD